MRPFAAVTLAMFAAAAAHGACPRDNPTPVVRVVFENCGTLKPKIKIKIDGATRDAQNKGSYYEADFTGHPVDATMDITVPEFGGVRKCCSAAEEFPIGNTADCYVQFTVTCDQPRWKLSVESGQAVKYERAHRNELGDAQCRRDGPDVLLELGPDDDAILTVPRDAQAVRLALTEISPWHPELPLKLIIEELLKQPGRPYDRKRLGEMLERELGKLTKTKNLSAAAEPLVERMKPTLPNSVTVKQQ